MTQEIDGGFGHDDFHDGFAIARAGGGAGSSVSVATTADQRRIADTAGKFAASAASGSGGEKAAVFIESDGANSALFVAAMVLGGVLVFRTAKIGVPFGFADEFFRFAEGHAVIFGKFFRAFSDEHHVTAMLINGASGANGIFDALQTSSGAAAKRSTVHHDGVTFDFAFGVEMRAEAGIEHGSIFENGDGGLDGVERGAAAGKDLPTFAEGFETALLAGVDGIVGNVPSTAVKDERRFHISQSNWTIRPAVRDSRFNCYPAPKLCTSCEKGLFVFVNCDQLYDFERFSACRRCDGNFVADLAIQESLADG